MTDEDRTVWQLQQKTTDEAREQDLTARMQATLAERWAGRAPGSPEKTALDAAMAAQAELERRRIYGDGNP